VGKPAGGAVEVHYEAACRAQDHWASSARPGRATCGLTQDLSDRCD
jgi:hypothetical protein